MSSANEHLPPPPKPRMSPLEFRNTDLVSRLLAATPPYLYNMSLLPNTYFFSEMLRSFVQAKAERNSATLHPPMRRSRKRAWASSRSECFQKSNLEQKPEEKQDNSADWMIKSNKKTEENPLELTMSKPENVETYQSRIESFNTKVEGMPEPMFPNLHPNLPQDGTSSNLVLPPPPPMWYPPLYPAPPYGIDPLHFFIDLRVSGHIYDRKNQKDSNHSPSESYASSSPKERHPQNDLVEVKNETDALSSIFKHPRHSSAFSVPTPSINKNPNPINLCEKEGRSTKFDVKSMGFDKHSNRTSTNYIMNNITSIYKQVGENKIEEKFDEDNKEESEEEREKRVKDLRALIGLELVVDYMKQKPGKSHQIDSLSSTDVESVGSPALEVVAVNDEN